MLITITNGRAFNSSARGAVMDNAYLINCDTPTVASTPDTVIASTEDNSALKNPITYNATDSMVFDLGNEKAFLYNGASVVYEDTKLEAGYIELDFGKNLLRSKGMLDSTGNIVQKPVSTQAGEKFNAGEIIYNFKSKKGKIKDVVTQQGDGYIHGTDIKRDSTNVYYVAGGKYTTCDAEHPHFYIGAKKIKVIPNDKIITGPAELYISDIPTPLVLPFGFFPNKKGRASGILIPTYGESNQWGFFLKDGGFYFGTNEFVDLALRSDIYANGSFGGQASSNYNYRYHYNGNMNFKFSQIINGIKELPSTTRSNVFFVQWKHVQDSKANPSSRFSADVNAGSSSYNKFNGSINGASAANTNGSYFQNTMQSNVVYSKVLTGTPFNFSMNARHSQNTISKKVDVSLPEIALTMNRIYPFKNKNAVSPKWYDKVGVSAALNARNEIHTYDSLFFTNHTFNTMQNGAQLSVPISTSLNLFKYFTFSPSLSIKSSMYRQTISKHFDGDSRTVITDTVNGLAIANDYSAQASFNTRLYGDYFFRTKRLKQIRHVATPSISISYRPDFSESQYGYYKYVQSDTTGITQQYSRFQNGIYGSPGAGQSGNIAFGLNNTLEAKMRQKTDSGSVDKKVSLIDNFNAGVSYNVAAKTFKWSNISLAGRTKLFKKLDVNTSASLDPYQLDSTGTRIERFEWENKKIGRITAAMLSLSTSLRPTDKKVTSNTGAPAPAPLKTTSLDYIYNNPNMYVDFSIPWNLTVYYNLNYSKPNTTKTITQTVTLNGDISVSKYWKVSVASGYDFVHKEVTVTSLNVYRDLHCWEMRFTWVPFGFRQSFSLNINVKSSTLKDLKLTRKKDWYDYQ